MIKVAHFADTHIRNLKYHKEYRIVFRKIFDILIEEKPDYIVHCGDIAHTKTQISPEFVEMAAWFFKSLADIAPTYITLGNHDGNLKNSSRQDALTPIVDALGIPDLHLLKDAGEVHLTEELTLNVLSVFDEENWQKITDPDKINVALYHGSVSGVKTDTGFVMEYGDHDIGIFEGFDYVMLGDIHKTNQKLDDEGRVRYPGSTVQQNHGETNDKGFLIWDIEDKDKFDVRHIAIENPSPFFTLELTPEGRIPDDAVVPDNARLRLAVAHRVSLNAIRKAMDVAKTKFKPVSVTFYNRSSSNLTEAGSELELVEDEDLRDLQVQERIIQEFLKDYHVEPEVLGKILELNRRYHAQAEQEEEVVRNVRWSLKNLEWDNLFLYGDGNSIDFANLSGVVGIFGKNFSGKSSIIDSLLWTIFNSTSKSFRKNLEIINQNKAHGSGRAEIQIGQRNFVVDRRATKIQKQTRAGTEESAKTELDFGYYDPLLHEVMPEENKQNINGNTRPETDKNVRRMFGTLDDFLLTSMASQRDSLSFVSAKSSDRKQILAKFLDLEIFEKKYRLANDDALDLRGALKKLEGRDFDGELKQVVVEAAQNERQTGEYKERIDTLKASKSEWQKKIAEVDIEIVKAPELEVVDEDELRNELESLKRNETSYEESIPAQRKEIEDLVADLLETKALVAEFDVDQIKKDSDKADAAQKRFNKLFMKLTQEENKKKRQEKQTQLLSEVPCGDKFPQCKFLHNAYAAQKEMPDTEELIQITRTDKDGVEEEIKRLDPEGLKTRLDRYYFLEEQRRKLQSKIANLKVKAEKNSSSLVTIKNNIEKIESKLETYLKNKEAVKHLRVLHSTKKQYQMKLDVIVEELEQCQDELTELWKEHGSLEQKWNSLEDSKLELAELREQYAAYDLYLKCMHGNGIAYDIIKKRLPIINEQIARILANVVNFEIYLEDKGKELPIMIRHPKYPPRSLSGGSGAELTLAAMAIRLALIRISSLPVGDLFILDEPATSLDEENMEGFTRIIDMLKLQFKTIILVSHLDALKDIVDTHVVIEKNGGYAQVNV